MYQSPALVIGNEVFSNTAVGPSNGGGIYLYESPAVLRANAIFSNVAGLGGGGLYLYRSPAGLSENVVVSNTAVSYGGGLRLHYSDGARLTGNTIRGNRGQFGGGLYLWYSDIELSVNSFIANVASESHGGGLYLHRSSDVISRNLFISNTAALDGGGLYIRQTPDVTLTNNVVVDNQADGSGSGLYIERSAPRLLHTTIARNQGGDGSGIYLNNPVVPAWLKPIAPVMTNTILVSHGVGISVSAGSVITINGVLWDRRTPITISRSALTTSVSVSHQLVGEPAFSLDGYHLLPESDAIDKGVHADVDVDIDGEPRPRGSTYDLGADEQGPILFAAFEHSAPHWLGQETVFTNTTVFSGHVYYRWGFGDGASSSDVNPGHTYKAAGEYTVVLTATSGDLRDVATRRVVIYAASFTSSSPDWLGQTTIFTNTTAAGRQAEYLWDLGDGLTSTQEHVTHTYASPGFYSVVLKAANAEGSGVVGHDVVVYGPPDVSYVASPTMGFRPLTVEFTPVVSTTPPADPSLAYVWDFGDGRTSTLTSPSHQYVATGVYTVGLRVSNPVTTVVEVKPELVVVKEGRSIYLPLVVRGG